MKAERFGYVHIWFKFYVLLISFSLLSEFEYILSIEEKAFNSLLFLYIKENTYSGSVNDVYRN